MLSSEMESEGTAYLRRQQSRFSVLLSLLKRHLTSQEYRALLQMQVCCRRLGHGLTLEPHLQVIWAQMVESQLDTVFAGLDRGHLSRPQFQRLVHLYQDLFLLFADKSGATKPL